MRATGAFALVVMFAGSAHAEQPFEASGFVGVGVFGDQIELGNSWASEQIPNTSPVVGARFGWLALPSLLGARDDVHLGVGVEAEVALATAFTGESDEGRTSYFAPVFGWRAHGILRLGGLGRVTPHLLVGGGGETVASSSPYMAKETDSLFYWGSGMSVAVNDRWLVRLDLRHGVMAARDDGMTSTLEAQLGIAARFGKTAPKRVVIVEPTKPVEPVQPPEPVKPPAPPDLDGDGLVGVADTCPESPEDFDKFQDDDGCPDLDNDSDGIEDGRDACPIEAETKNGFDDGDGCPDTIPADVTKALTAKLGFEANRARVTPAAAVLLRPLYQMMVARPDVKIRITGHADKGGDDLAKRRADAVKWWLVDQGITEGRIAITLGAAGTPVIELSLRTE